jgi:hypothetical protein
MPGDSDIPSRRRRSLPSRNREEGFAEGPIKEKKRDESAKSAKTRKKSIN